MGTCKISKKLVEGSLGTKWKRISGCRTEPVQEFFDVGGDFFEK